MIKGWRLNPAMVQLIEQKKRTREDRISQIKIAQEKLEHMFDAWIARGTELDDRKYTTAV